MNRERFEALAEAYGGDLRRWPAAERATAEAWVASETSARAPLDAASETDALLSESPNAIASPALTQRIVALAPAARAARGAWAWLTGAGVGAALAGAAASGVLVAGLFAPQITALTAPHEAPHSAPDEAVATLSDSLFAGEAG
jgi:hypothetical protein